MDKRTEEILEFAKVKKLLAERTATVLGRKMVEALGPSADIETVNVWQKETSEAKALLGYAPEIPFGGIRNLRPHLRRVSVGGALEPGELLEVADTLSGGRRLRGYLTGEETAEHQPRLAALAAGIGIYNSVENEIRACINDYGEVKDSASEELGRLRRQIRAANSRIKERLDAFLHAAAKQKMIQEPIVTMRGDRYVIPVKQEYRGQVPGIIHDQSASGATLFIEPMAVVEANNDLRQFLLKEKQEIQRLLAELSGLVATRAEEIEDTLAILARLDFIFAKARFSYDLRGSEPALNTRGRLAVRQGRHPLLQGDVVPIDLTLGKQFDTLVITGPNTGGKTVTLKTIGLLTLMAQAGLHVPADPGTELAVFRQIFCDIGDEQSIEQNLSTFSGHMRNIVRILRSVQPGSLVLLDEIGAGTDPTEGAALAMSILEHLHAAGVKTVATTHYSELKAFAFTRERVENASVEFDVDTLRPTYRLLLGMPGRSNAFEIAGRLGLPSTLVKQARQMMRQEDVQVDEMLSSIGALEGRLQKEKMEAETMKRELAELRSEHVAKLSDLQKREQAIISRAQSEARTIVRLARSEAESVIKELRELSRQVPASQREKVIRESRERLRQVRMTVEDTAGEIQPEEAVLSPGEIKKGMSVFIKSLNQKGYILNGPNATGDVEVQAGIMRVTVPAGELRRATEEKATPAQSAGVGRILVTKSAAAASELDLRGMMVEETLLKLDKYLDDAMLAGLKQVRIIHGKGTGALRSAVQEYLAGNGRIKSFRPGESGEGGLGVTVAYLS